MGLSRGCRLTEKRQYDRVLKERTLQLRNGPFQVYATTNGELCARLGLIVGKRLARRAVDRNRIKRALRESFRKCDLRLPPLDIVVQLVTAAHAESLNADTHALWPLLSIEIHKENDDHRSR
jgi:ribonuclease P protein component